MSMGNRIWQAGICETPDAVATLFPPASKSVIVRAYSKLNHLCTQQLCVWDGNTYCFGRFGGDRGVAPVQRHQVLSNRIIRGKVLGSHHFRGAQHMFLALKRGIDELKSKLLWTGVLGQGIASMLNVSSLNLGRVGIGACDVCSRLDILRILSRRQEEHVSQPIDSAANAELELEALALGSSCND